jgi:hypothetical protein
LRPVQLQLWRVLDHAQYKLICAQILEAWPPDEPKTNQTVECGDLKRDGNGVRGDPFRYWLPALENLWKNDLFIGAVQRSCDEGRRLAREGKVSPLGDLLEPPWPDEPEE